MPQVLQETISNASDFGELREKAFPSGPALQLLDLRLVAQVERLRRG